MRSLKIQIRTDHKHQAGDGTYCYDTDNLGGCFMGPGSIVSRLGNSGGYLHALPSRPLVAYDRQDARNINMLLTSALLNLRLLEIAWKVAQRTALLQEAILVLFTHHARSHKIILTPHSSASGPSRHTMHLIPGAYLILTKTPYHPVSPTMSRIIFPI